MQNNYIRELKKTANQVRKNIITAVYYAKAGHPGGSLSAASLYEGDECGSRESG